MSKPITEELTLVNSILDDALNSIYSIQQSLDTCSVCNKEHIPMDETSLSNIQALDEIEMFINDAKDELQSAQDELAWIDRRSLVNNY